MSKAANMALANFLSVLGAQVPGIVKNYQEGSLVEEEYNRKKRAREGAAEILRGLPRVAAPGALDEVAGTMSPGQAQAVLAATPPETQAEALGILTRARQGADALRLQMPQRFPAAPGVERALPALTEPPKPAPDVLETLRPIIRDMESSGNYAQLHPRTKSGKQALGAYGILPEVWFKAFPQFGLDAARPEDRQRFLQSPALQDAMFTEIAKKGLADTGGDLRKFRAWYYGGPNAADSLGSGKEFVPQSAFVNGKAVAMPSVADDVDLFMKRLEAAGVDPSAAMATAPGQLPWDNSILSQLIKEPPKLREIPKKVSYGDQERYILSKVQDPEQLAMLGPYLQAIGGLAKGEREQEQQGREDFRSEMTQYGQNVRADAELRFNTWKAMQEKIANGHKLRQDEIAALRAQRDSFQKQLQDVREFQKRVGAGKEPQEVLAAAYPEYFTTKSEGASALETLFFGDGAEPTQVTKFDPEKMQQSVQALQEAINGIDRALSSRSGAPAPAESPNTIPDLSKYLKPRKK